MQKHKEHIDNGKIHLISGISLALGFSQALILYVVSSFYREASGTENVGVFYFISNLIVLFGLLNMHKLIRRMGKATVFLFFFFMQICLGAFLVVSGPTWLGVLILMAHLIAVDMVWVSLDIILESYSTDQQSGRIRGLHLMIMNIGFLAGPFLSTSILERYGYSELFFVAMLINMLIFVVAMVWLRRTSYVFREQLTVKDLARKIFVNKELMNIYYVSFLLEFFYALMTIYMPLYLVDRGLGWDKIGIIFTIMLIPFVLVEYPAGILADKKSGHEKKMIIISLVIIALSTLSIFFIKGSHVWIWAAVLFVTRIGAALLEVLRDSYFYKKIDGRDVDIIGFFRTARPVSYIIAATISAMSVALFGVSAVFVVIAIAALLTLFPALRLIDNKC